MELSGETQVPEAIGPACTSLEMTMIKKSIAATVALGSVLALGSVTLASAQMASRAPRGGSASDYSAIYPAPYGSRSLGYGFSGNQMSTTGSGSYGASLQGRNPAAGAEP